MSNLHISKSSRLEFPRDITPESLLADLEKLEREDPAAFAHHQRAQQALHEGDESLFIAMSEGLTLRQARKELAAQEARRRRERADPGEYRFECQLEELRHSIPKALKAGEIYYPDLVASPAPIFGIEMTPRQWRKFQTIVPDWVPWKTPAQRAAYEQHFRYVQRALAVQVFSSFSIAKRRKHWEAWWRHESPPPNWRGWDEGQTKWTIHRNELQRQIARDQVGAF